MATNPLTQPPPTDLLDKLYHPRSKPNMAETTEVETNNKRTRGPGKRTRRNYQGELMELQGRVDMALKLLRKTKVDAGPNSLLEVAIETLEGKE